MPEAIIVQNLSKSFRRYHADRPTTLKEALLRGLRRLAPAERFWALRDVSFSIAPGRMVGVIGPNGAGKSTLLRLIGGVGRPDQGNVEAHGRIDSIVDFAELETFIDNPLRTYSTGMQMRLGFAVAVHTDPEILLIDEILAVGDLAFQRKCLDRIAQFKDEGCTIVLVSHDTDSIQQLCDEALWLRRGRLVAYGPADVVASQYVEEMSAETRRRTPATHPVVRTPTGAELRVNENRFGSMEMEIVAVRLLAPVGFPVTELDSGDPVHIEIEYLAPQPIEAPIFGVIISREDGVICYDTHTAAAGLTLPTIQGRGQVALQLERLDLTGGQYYIDVSVYERDWAYAYDSHWHVYPLLIRSTGHNEGILRPPNRWKVGDVSVRHASLPTFEAS